MPRLADAFDRLGRPPVAALTATASPLVRRGIIEDLGWRDLVVVVGGFDRPNLRLEVEHHVSETEKRDAVLSTVAEMAGPVLVYKLLHRVYSALSADGPKRLKDLRTELGVRGRRLTTAVNLLDRAGAVTSGRSGFAASGEPGATAVGRAATAIAAGTTSVAKRPPVNDGRRYRSTPASSTAAGDPESLSAALPTPSRRFSRNTATGRCRCR